MDIPVRVLQIFGQKSKEIDQKTAFRREVQGLSFDFLTNYHSDSLNASVLWHAICNLRTKFVVTFEQFAEEAFQRLFKDMGKEIASSFHQFMVDRFGYYEAKHLHQKMNIPSHPVTKAFNTPEKTPHKILIAFCELLDMHPHELIRDYKLGDERISEIEKNFHERIYNALQEKN